MTFDGGSGNGRKVEQKVCPIERSLEMGIFREMGFNSGTFRIAQ